MTQETRSLKAQNRLTIVGIIALDGSLLFAFAHGLDPTHPEMWTGVVAMRAAVTVGASFAVLLLSSLLPPPWKDVLVFWRIKDTLPGCRAFTTYAVMDPRVDTRKLASAYGPPPDSPREQNVLWYRLFKEAEKAPEVEAQHRLYLLFRELTALSMLMLAIAAGCLAVQLIDKSPATWGWAMALFTLQYLLTAISARNHGVRLVSTVLAVHSARDYSPLAGADHGRV